MNESVNCGSNEKYYLHGLNKMIMMTMMMIAHDKKMRGNLHKFIFRASRKSRLVFWSMRKVEIIHIVISW